MENSRLIYLNKLPIDARFQSKLNQLNPAALFYTDAQLAVDFLRATTTNDQFLLIISSDLPSDILFDSICSLQSIRAIFIYDTHDNHHQPISEELRRKYPKIIDQYLNEDDLLKSLDHFIDKQTFVYSLLDFKPSASFLWYQMLIPILQRLPQNSDDFRENYTSQQAIQWFTMEYFPSKLVNRALRTRNIGVLHSLAFFILDLYSQIQREFQQLKNQGNLIVYRAQWLCQEEIEILRSSIGSRISIHEFFTASRDRNTSLAVCTPHFPTHEHVLFEIHVDLSIETIPLADLPSLNEVLFSMNSLFRIESMEFDSTDQLWNIKLLASNARDAESIEKEVDCGRPMIYFGHLLWNELREIEQAEHFFQILLKSYPADHQDLPNIYMELGDIDEQIREYNLALKYYQDALDIYQNQIPKDNAQIGLVLNRIGVVYKHLGDLDRAIEFYQQQYQIEESYLPIDHPNLILHFDSIINIFKTKDQIDRAIEFCQEKLPHYENHPRPLVHLLISFATMYEDKNPKISDRYYQRALALLEQNNTDESFAQSLSTMTNFYWKCRMFDRALICQTKLLHFHRSTLLSNHDDIAHTLHGLARLYRAMNKSTEALQYFEQSLVILRANHGPEHLEVKNIQKEIVDLKDILRSISSSANKDYHNRQISSAQKQSSTSITCCIL